MTFVPVLLAVGIAFHASSARSQTFDFENGKAPVEVIIPRVIPVIFEAVSPTAGDATLVLRITTLITNAWFDAIAPYHPTAIGVYSRLERQPESEATDRNKNVAILYASYRVLNSLLPRHDTVWREMLESVDLDPDDDREDAATAVGIGNLAGAGVVAARERDGMNQLGDEGGRTYNPQPYADYLGYEPVNTPYRLRDPSRWQPNIFTRGNGIFQVQQFVTPQLRVTLPYSYDDPGSFRVDRPRDSNPRGPGGRAAYQRQADEVLAVSAALSDEQKMAAELFDNKLTSLGFSALFASQTRDLTLDEFVHYDFLTNVAAFDGAIATWNQKYRWDAVRPFSAIRYLYGDRPVTAWGGPREGTVAELPGHCRSPRISVRLGLLLQCARAGESPLLRFRRARMGSALRPGLVAHRTRVHAGQRHRPRLGDLDRLRDGLRSQPPVGRRPLRGCDHRRRRPVSADRRPCLRLRAGSYQRDFSSGVRCTLGRVGGAGWAKPRPPQR